jgi:RNA polymerase sigma-70 factor, ECF subfamily
MNESEVQDLLQQVRAGEPGALEQLLAGHRRYLLNVVGKRMDPHLMARADPSDIVQEAQLEAVRRIDDYLQREPMPFHLWLRKTACEHLLRMRRRHIEASRRTTTNEIQLPDNSSALIARQILSTEPNPRDAAIEHEAMHRLQQAISALPPLDAEILLMRTVECLSNQEAAQVLEIEESAASKKFGRSILKLRQVLLASGLTDSKL